MDIIIGTSGFIGQKYSKHLSEVGYPYTPVASSQVFSQFLVDQGHAGFHNVSNIIWLAGNSFPVNTESSTSPYYARDFGNLNLLLKLVVHKEWAGRLIFLSSAGCIYKESDRALSEESELYPSNAYGLLKLEQEKLIREAGVKHTILRVSNVFGKRFDSSPHKDVISTWINNFRKGNVSTVYGSLESFRDFVNVKDVVNAIFLAGNQERLNHTLNIGSGSKTTILELVSIFSSCSAGRMKFEFQNPRAFDAYGYYLDISLAKSSLGWNPRFSDKSDIEEFVVQELSI